MFNMEISQHIIKEAFSLKSEKTLNSELKREMIKLNVLSIEEILFDNEKNKIDSKIRNIHNRLFSNSSEPNPFELKKTINTLNEFLFKGIEKDDSKSVLIFIYANCYFMINPKWFLNQVELKNISKRKISKTLFDLLSKVNFTTSTKNGAPRNEITLLNDYNTGISENNLKKVYDFVEVLERGNRGFHLNYILERVCWFMYYLNNKSYLKLINNLTKPEEFIFFFQSLNGKELIKIANSKCISNQWANIELIRQITKKEVKNDAINLNLSKAIYNQLIEIKKNDFKFLKQTISHFDRNILFNSALGRFLTTVSILELEEIVNDSMLIDKYDYKNKARRSLLVYYAKNGTDLQLNHFVKLVYTKWELFFEALFNDDDFYTNNLLLTDYCEFIVEYYVSLKTDDEIIESFLDLLNKISSINCIWFKNSVNQISHFYLYLSKLYLLSYAFQVKNIINENINLNFVYLKNDAIILSKFDRDDNLEKYLTIINENLC